MPQSSPLPLITSEAFDALTPEWAALHAATPSATPFTHPSWHRTWLRHFGAGVEPIFLAVRRGEQLVGVFAITADNGVARTLGDPNVRDYGGPLCLQGEEGAIAAAIVEWLLEDMTPALEMWGVLAGSPIDSALRLAADQYGWASEVLPEAVCPALELPAEWDTYVGSLGKHDRHELRRKLRHLDAVGTVSFAASAEPAGISERTDQFLNFMRISRRGKGEFLTPVMQAFLHDLLREFASLGMARLATMSLDGEALAMTCSFLHGETEYLYNSGYDSSASRLAVGVLSKALGIKDAIARGIRRYDFLRGDEEYKRHLGGHHGEVVTIRAGSVANR